jgi:hypothetical protein
MKASDLIKELNKLPLDGEVFVCGDEGEYLSVDIRREEVDMNDQDWINEADLSVETYESIEASGHGCIWIIY